MSKAKPDRNGQERAELAHAAPETAREIGHWLAYLGAERRMSPETVEAYGRDVRQFLAFLNDHFGRRVSLAMLGELATRDVRAFMAHRRSEGIGGRSLMRGLAGARSFARFLERQGKGRVAALSAIRAPKVEKTLPKPLAVTPARRIADTGLRAGEEREPWVLARDAAVLRSEETRLNSSHVSQSRMPSSA